MDSNPRTNPRLSKRGRAALATLLALASFPPFVAPAPARPSSGLVARTPEPRVHYENVPRGVYLDAIVLKIAEGTHVRLRDGKLRMLADLVTPAEQDRMDRLGLAPAQVEADCLEINETIAADSNLSLSRIEGLDEDLLDQMKEHGELNSQSELADMNLYYILRMQVAEPKPALDLLNRLNEYPSVEFADFARVSYDATAEDIAPTTPDWVTTGVAMQGYLGPASTSLGVPCGIDVAAASAFPGGRGDDVRIADIEQSWHLDHEDLPGDYFMNEGIYWGDGEHGTQVLGVLGAQSNQYGFTGIAPDAVLGVCSVVPFFGFGAVLLSGSRTRPGDIVLIEQQYFGPATGLTCVVNCSQFEMVPTEHFRPDFDAIRLLTTNGRIVVEAAGNGSMDLDNPLYGSVFNRASSVRGDSGAIMVGAGTPFDDGVTPALTTQMWSNAGSRVDVQGWGDSVSTTGGGTIRTPGAESDVRQFYTNNFTGTSSASPIVAGAAACINGLLRGRGLAPLTGLAMRSLLASTGTAPPVPTPGRPIGPMPNLRAAIAALALEAPRPSTWPIVPGVTANFRPTVVANPSGRLVLLTIGANNAVFAASQPVAGAAFGAPVQISPFGLRLTGRISAVNHSPDGRIEFFVRGEDGNIYKGWQGAPEGAFAGFDQLGVAGGWTSDPAATVNADGRLEVFVRGSDLQLYHIYMRSVPGGWFTSIYEPLGGTLAGAPTAVRNAGGALEVYARRADGRIIMKRQAGAGGAFGDWEDFGLTITADALATTDAAGRVQVFARGADEALWHRGVTPAGLGPWVRIGGQMAVGATPAAALDGMGQLVVAYREQSDSSIRFTRFGGFWPAPTSLGGNVAGDAVLAQNRGRFQAFSMSARMQAVVADVP